MNTGRTTNDLLMVFAKWCFKEESGKYNVSNALWRLEDYVTWIEKSCKGNNYNKKTMTMVFKLVAFFLTHNKHGQLCYFVSLTHVVMLDEGAQAHGMVSIGQIGKSSVFNYMTMIPIELGTKFNM